MRPIQSLSPADRHAAFGALLASARRGAREGWKPWELPEYVKAAACALDITLRPSDVAYLLRDGTHE
jgi:hypothetical protein